MTEFVGAKAALFCEGQILTYLRDDKPGLPWAGAWDLPGGGREGGESAVACLFREVEEEFGLRLTPDHLRWQQMFPAMLRPGQSAWFFGGVLSVADIAGIHFGDEGQDWCLMSVADWLTHKNAVPELQRRTGLALAAMGLTGA